LEVWHFGQARKQYGVKAFVTADVEVVQHTQGLYPSQVVKKHRDIFPKSRR